MKIVFMGSSDFGIPALKELLKHHMIIGVVSTPAKPQGRGLKVVESPIAVFAEENGIRPILKPNDLKSPDFLEELKELDADLFVVVAFKILPRSIFLIPRFGTVNIHASILPRYRGPAPIQRAIEAGEKETGVTIFKIDEGIDTGEILLQNSIPIQSEETTPELFEKLSIAGAQMLVKAIDNLEKGKFSYIPQEHGKSSKAPKLKKEEAHIVWLQSSLSIFNKIRAFKPFPGTYTILGDKRLGIEWAEVIDEITEGNSGTIKEVSESYFDVQCNPGILRILRVKPEGRKVMNVHDFLLGNRLVEGDMLK